MGVPTVIYQEGGPGVKCKPYKDQRERYLTSGPFPYKFQGHYHLKQASRHVIQD